MDHLRRRIEGLYAAHEAGDYTATDVLLCLGFVAAGIGFLMMILVVAVLDAASP